MGVTGFFHAGVTVKDMDVALGFYRDGLGLEVAFLGESAIQYARRIWNQDPERVRVAFLKVPNSESFVELFEFQGLERHGASARPVGLRRGPHVPVRRRPRRAARAHDRPRLHAAAPARS